MGRRSAACRWMGAACLGLAALMAAALAWPVGRQRVDLSLSGEAMRSAWIPSVPADEALDAPPPPSLDLLIDLPSRLLLGREEALGLAVIPASIPGGAASYSLAAEITSADAVITPPGESGQALAEGASFSWKIVARHPPQAAATLLVRLRRHSPGGAAGAERLVLARDIVLPVRTVIGLSDSTARLAAAALGLAGSLLAVASAIRRTP